MITPDRLELLKAIGKDVYIANHNLVAELVEHIEHLNGVVDTFHQKNLEKITQAAESGNVQFAKCDVVDYLAPEIEELYPELGVKRAWISDESRGLDFPKSDDSRYVWQMAIDLLRCKLEQNLNLKPSRLEMLGTIQYLGDQITEEQNKHNHFGVHLSHCNFGENIGRCKYGEDETCPSLTEAWSWFGKSLTARDRKIHKLENELCTAKDQIPPDMEGESLSTVLIKLNDIRKNLSHLASMNLSGEHSVRKEIEELKSQNIILDPVPLRQMLDDNGAAAQLRMLQEECAELIVAINHYLRSRIPNEVLFEEIADVHILLKQAEMWAGGAKVILPSVEKKMKRLIDRLARKEAVMK